MESSAIVSKSKNLQGSEWFDEPGVVYFISAGSDCEACKSIKIGVTVRDGLLRRLRSIQSSNHTTIRLLRVIEFASMREAEKKENELHKRFGPKDKEFERTVGYEWFRATDELLRTIEEQGTLPGMMESKPRDLELVLELFTV